jgi:hypothetical protein
MFSKGQSNMVPWLTLQGSTNQVDGALVWAAGECHFYEKFKKLLKKDKNSRKPINDYVISSMRKREEEIDHNQEPNKI